MRKLAPSVDTNDNSVMSSYQAAETYKNMFPGQCASASIAIQPFWVLAWICTCIVDHARANVLLIIVIIVSGDSANAVPPTKKLRTRVTRIWGDRSRQPNLSAMEGPRAEPTA